MKRGQRKLKQKKSSILNLTDLPRNVHVEDPYSDSVQKILLPLDDIAEQEPEQSGESVTKLWGKAFEGVDLWEEVRAVLTLREFQIFELKYRYQYVDRDIVELTGLDKSRVSHTLTRAVEKLRMKFNRDLQKEKNGRDS